MSKDLRQQLVQTLHNSLELKRHTVGVRFIYSEDDFDACPARPIQYHMPYCMIVKSAAAGYALKAKPENIGCFAAARALGWTEVSDTYKSGEDYMGFGMFDNQTVSKKVVDNISICQNHSYAIEVSALELMEKDPDLIIQISEPYNVMRIVQGYNYYHGTYTNYKMGGLQAMCGEATAYTYESQNINVTMMCAGTRFLCQWERSELAVAMPYDKFQKTIDGLVKTINPLERDGDKKRIELNYQKAGLPDLGIEYGKNYDTNYYQVGKSGII